MAIYTITITLTEAQDTVIKSLAAKINVTPEQFFQRFWDGYEGDRGDKKVFVKGAIKAQIDQWINDELKSAMENDDSAEMLVRLSR